MAAQQAATQQPRQRNVITAEEIERLNSVEDAYQVVLRLRPEFLRVRARSQIRSPMPTPGEGPGAPSRDIQPKFPLNARTNGSTGSDGHQTRRFLGGRQPL